MGQQKVLESKPPVKPPRGRAAAMQRRLALINEIRRTALPEDRARIDRLVREFYSLSARRTLTAAKLEADVFEIINDDSVLLPQISLNA